MPGIAFATASTAAFDRSSTGRIRTWLRIPARPSAAPVPGQVLLLPPRAPQVVGVHQIPGRDRAPCQADRNSVFDDPLALGEVPQGDLVAKGYGRREQDRESGARRQVSAAARHLDQRRAPRPRRRRPPGAQAGRSPRSRLGLALVHDCLHDLRSALTRRPYSAAPTGGAHPQRGEHAVRAHCVLRRATSPMESHQRWFT